MTLKVKKKLAAFVFVTGVVLACVALTLSEAVRGKGFAQDLALGIAILGGLLVFSGAILIFVLPVSEDIHPEQPEPRRKKLET